MFVSSDNQTSLKPGVLKVGGLGWDGALRVLHYSWRESRQAVWGQMALKCIKLTGKTLFTYSWSTYLRVGIQRGLSETKEPAGTFPYTIPSA